MSRLAIFGIIKVLHGRSELQKISKDTIEKVQMNFTRILFLLVPLAFSSGSLLALDASETIKATPVLKTQDTWYGQEIVYPEGKAEMTGVVVEMAPGAETGWHMHPVPSVGYVMEGELEVHFKNGDIKQLSAGESAAEAVNVYHNGRNVGDEPVKLLIFYVGTTDQTLTVKENEE
jgi:quercetin dioxygenase-like cupin family protein